MFFNCGKIYRTKFPFLKPILGVQFSDIKYIHHVLQLSPPSISKMFSSPETETLLIKQWPPFPFPPAPGGRQSAFCPFQVFPVSEVIQRLILCLACFT